MTWADSNSRTSPPIATNPRGRFTYPRARELNKSLSHILRRCGLVTVLDAEISAAHFPARKSRLPGCRLVHLSSATDMGDPKLPFFVYGTLLVRRAACLGRRYALQPPTSRRCATSHRCDSTSQLQEGFHNHDRLLRPHSPKHTPAAVEGPLAMFHMGVFPGVVNTTSCAALQAHHPELASTTARIRGELVHVGDDVYESVRERLDMLEGYSPADDDNLYDRIRVKARVLKRTATATVAGVTAEAATTVAVADAASPAAAAAGGAAAMPTLPASAAGEAAAAPTAEAHGEHEEEVVDAWMYIMSNVAFATMRTSKGVAHVPDGDWGSFERARRAAAAATAGAS